MNKREVFFMIYSNKHDKNSATVLLSDFLCISRLDALKMYDFEYTAFVKEMEDKIKTNSSV